MHDAPSVRVSTVSREPVKTGVTGLDDILCGGLPPAAHVPGRGSARGRQDDPRPAVPARGRAGGASAASTSRSPRPREELPAVAASHGWSLDGIARPSSSSTARGELERRAAEHDVPPFRGGAQRDHRARCSRRSSATKPQRVVFDSLSEMRLLAQRLRCATAGRSSPSSSSSSAGDCTVLLLDDRTVRGQRPAAAEHRPRRDRARAARARVRRPSGGGSQVLKLRGSGSAAATTTSRIAQRRARRCSRGSSPPHHREPYRRRRSIASGVAGLDALLGGGLERGTSTSSSGPPGAASRRSRPSTPVPRPRRGERVALFIFDETAETLRSTRDRRAGHGARRGPGGRAALDPPGRSRPSCRPASSRTRCATRSSATTRAWSSSTASTATCNAMPEERFLSLQLHELLTYLGQQGVVTFLVVLAQHGMIGTTMQSPIDTSYLADTVVLLRYFEAGGRGAQGDLGASRRASGPHERTDPRVPARRRRASGRRAARASSTACSPACRPTLGDRRRPCWASEWRTMEPARARSSAILVLAPTGRDAATRRQMLGRAGLAADRRAATSTRCAREIEAGAAPCIVAEEALRRAATWSVPRRAPGAAAAVVGPAARRRSPAAGRDVGGGLDCELEPLGNVTLLERPVRVRDAGQRACRPRCAPASASTRCATRRCDGAEALRKPTARKDEFLAMLAHELRNPLAADPQRAPRSARRAGPATRTLRRAGEIVAPAGRRTWSRLVDDLLDVSRITRGKVELRARAARPAGLLAQAVERPAAPDRREAPACTDGAAAAGPRSTPTRRGWSRWSATCSTTRRSTRPRAGTIWLSAGAEARRHGRVRDNGAGIPPAMLPPGLRPVHAGRHPLDRRRAGSASA